MVDLSIDHNNKEISVESVSDLELMTDSLRNIIGKKVNRLFLVIWPPLGEECISQTDISAGYIFEGNNDELYVISTDKNDLTKPVIEYQSIPNKYFDWNDFKPRMVKWMNSEKGMELKIEYYEVSGTNVFRNINGCNIIDAQLIQISGDKNPIGVKLIFENDYILSFPIIDGNTIESSEFNRNDNFKSFLSLGEIKYNTINP